MLENVNERRDARENSARRRHCVPCLLALASRTLPSLHFGFDFAVGGKSNTSPPQKAAFVSTAVLIYYFSFCKGKQRNGQFRRLERSSEISYIHDVCWIESVGRKVAFAVAEQTVLTVMPLSHLEKSSPLEQREIANGCKSRCLSPVLPKRAFNVQRMAFSEHSTHTAAEVVLAQPHEDIWKEFRIWVGNYQLCPLSPTMYFDQKVLSKFFRDANGNQNKTWKQFLVTQKHISFLVNTRYIQDGVDSRDVIENNLNCLLWQYNRQYNRGHEWHINVAQCNWTGHR